MKAWIAVMLAQPDGRVAKYLDFETEAEADAHVAAFLGRFPDALVAPAPGQGGVDDWVVSGGALLYDPPPAPPPVVREPTAAELARILVAKGAIAQADLDAEVAKRERPLPRSTANSR